ncbi:acyl-CoA reductase [Fluviicola taffensis]|uniref:Acyl-CoA reductase n=1 Tax=Fluviicola taffensis (strain DSM 16823 / NCIMB 13979 / RW262) TaxID=755732 RepID=F2IDC2_FLUTR|nr:acyl-CoA reductase [Fluviicola taffensis]AEA45537.1 acyl-CoA reductase [Fluviicola taffensis DSM 16823]
MERKAIIEVFGQLRKSLNAVIANDEWPGYTCGLTEEEFLSFKKMINKEFQLNPWFTKENCLKALGGIVHLLDNESLTTFSENYQFTSKPKLVALIMAGNIPFVGFHDLLCTLLTGNKALCKLSSSDSRVPLRIIQWLIQWNPELKEYIQVSIGPIKNYDAVIATGSNNSIAQFETYFGHIPHLFRKNRTSIALLDGTETDDELKALSSDCFDFFGMGCRNASKLYLPTGFNLNRIFENFLDQQHLINHHKYGNNYDYNRTIFLMNQIPFLDNNVFMLKEDEGIHAPLSVIYYEFYTNQEEILAKIEGMKDELQAIVGHGFIPFGKAQAPDISDFADGVDTCSWLNSLS